MNAVLNDPNGTVGFPRKDRPAAVRARLLATVLLLLTPLAGCARGSASTPAEMASEGNAESPPDALRVTLDHATQELVLEMLPVDLPADAGDGGMPQPDPLYGRIPVDGFVHGYSVEVVDREGRAVPRSVVHHVNIMAPGRRELFSPIMQRIGAVGSETSPVSLPRLLGYPVARGDSILVSAMLHNPTGSAYDGARVRVRLPYTTSERLVGPIRVYPFYLDVMPPASVHRFDLPPGRFEKSWEGRPGVSGRILGMGGHLHRYAVALRLEDVTTGRTLWETRPILNERGDVIGMPQDRLWWRLGIPIDARHTYRLTAEYDNPTRRTVVEGGMGALGGIFAPARGEKWPAVDPHHEEYRLDVRIVLSHGMVDGRTADAHHHH